MKKGHGGFFCLIQYHMNILIVYHRIDSDGLASMAVVRNYLRKNVKDAVVSLYPFTYGDNEPVNEFLDHFETVYVLDCCLSSVLMKSLYQGGKLVWIDHHYTNIETAKENGFYLSPGVRQIGIGACELTYEYMNGSAAPRFISLLSAYDVWDKDRFDWEGVVLPFQYGVRNRLALSVEAFCQALESDIKMLENEILAEGKAIVSYIRNCGSRAVASYGQVVLICGHIAGLLIMTDNFGSVPYLEAARERGCKVIVCLNRNKEGNWKLACYAGDNDIDFNLGEYLKEVYGGGGHAGAAGASINEETALRILNEHYL